MRDIYGSYDLYYVYRYEGEAAWRDAYRKKYNTTVKRPLLKKAPESVRELIKKMNKAPVKAIKERLGTHRPSTTVDGEKIRPLLKSTIKPGIKPSVSSSISKSGTISSAKKMKTGELQAKTKRAKVNPMIALRTSQRAKSAKLKAASVKNFRDWNPDKKWAIQKGYTVRYSSKTNAVVLPELSLNSRKLTGSQRAALKGNRLWPSSRRGRSGSSTGSTYGSTSTGSTSTSSTTAGTGSAVTKSGGGSVGNSANTKDN